LTDLHLRLLRMVAKQRQRELDDHDSADHAGETASGGDRHDLEQAVGRTKANVTAAEARRRYPRAGRAGWRARARSG
jgi:hypothetical protein